MAQPEKTNVMLMHEPSENLSWVDIHGKGDVTVQIEKVTRGEVIGEKGRKKRMPFVAFKGASKRLGLNKTNTKTLIALYGKYAEDWVGQRCTLYITTTRNGEGDTVECIRIRNVKPAAKEATSAPVAPAEPASSEPTADEARMIAEREREEAARG